MAHVSAAEFGVGVVNDPLTIIRPSARQLDPRADKAGSSCNAKPVDVASRPASIYAHIAGVLALKHRRVFAQLRALDSGRYSSTPSDSSSFKDIDRCLSSSSSQGESMIIHRARERK